MAEEITVSIESSDSFAAPARHALTMLALIAGFRVRFLREGADIHYGPEPGDAALWLPSSRKAQDRLLEKYSAQPAAVDRSAFGVDFLSLFPASTNSPIASDIVAATFFFLSLHEQWTSAARDQFDRFPASASLLGARGELLRPVVAEYARVFASLLEQGGHTSPDEPRFDGHRAAAVMTHDIDYLSKFTPGLVFREVIKNFLFNRRNVPLPQRIIRLREYLQFAQEANDPYVQSILRMLEVEQDSGITGSWLFKAGGTDKRDVSYRLEGARARRMIGHLREAGHDVGLHPSFNAHADASMLSRERARLESAIGSSPRSIRQHYLRFLYPKTWRQQASEGFVVDSTLGFAEEEGFRNGCCHPFLPWDNEAQKALPIWELPLTVMDGTLAHYRGLDPAASRSRIDAVLAAVEEAGGVAVLLFHNTTYDAHDFPGWGEVFEHACAGMRGDAFLTESLPATVDAWLASAGYADAAEVMKVINSEPA